MCVSWRVSSCWGLFALASKWAGAGGLVGTMGRARGPFRPRTKCIKAVLRGAGRARAEAGQGLLEAVQCAGREGCPIHGAREAKGEIFGRAREQRKLRRAKELVLWPNTAAGASVAGSMSLLCSPVGKLTPTPQKSDVAPHHRISPTGADRCGSCLVSVFPGGTTCKRAQQALQ